MSAVATASAGTSLWQRAAGLLAHSLLLRRGQHLWAQNEKNRDLPLSKWDKLWTGAHLVLRDYAQGRFPPVFTDMRQTHLNEINTRFTTQGATLEEMERGEMRKPFWFGPSLHSYFTEFLKLTDALALVQARPPAKLLELGGGGGWTAEFLAQLGFRVVSTTLSPYEAETTRKRAEALRLKGLGADLQVLACPMEAVAEHVKERRPFDVVFVYEALHHAFDWRAAITSAYGCLGPGGWFLLCNEPNFLHTAISYRVALLTNTHEIGFRKSELVEHLRQTGFRRILSKGKQPHLFVRPHWLLAQK